MFVQGVQGLILSLSDLYGHYDICFNTNKWKWIFAQIEINSVLLAIEGRIFLIDNL